MSDTQLLEKTLEQIAYRALNINIRMAPNPLETRDWNYVFSGVTRDMTRALSFTDIRYTRSMIK